MNNDKATILMTDFVNNLDKGKNANDIEDAVDVANAFATISQAGIRSLMLEQISKNLKEEEAAGNERAYNIYRIEKLVMESSDKANGINLSDSLGIPEVYDVKNNYLADSSGRIIMQMFFYDDGSGKADFAILLRQFGDRKKWSISSTPDWIQFSSVNTKVPFLLFANRPLNGKTDQDEKAQKNLLAFLSSRGFQPSITVHRGHSFSLKYTIQKMPASSKVVVLGSCGAYQNLADILNITPDAYIISSKQVGYGEINVSIFMYLVEKLKAGGDINWPAMQKSVAGTIGIHKKEGFYDYVFPHQNLGALFIKAYKISLQQSGISFSY
jgi:hypothetical protein